MNQRELTSLVKSMMCGHNIAQTCSICYMNDHSTDSCPQMHDEPIAQANAIGETFNQQPQRKYDPFSQMYNPGWRDHPNFRYGNPLQNRPQNPPGFSSQQNFQPRQPNPSLTNNSNGLSNDNELKEIKEMMKTFATNSLSLQQQVTSMQQNLSSLQQKSDNLERQIRQIGRAHV